MRISVSLPDRQVERLAEVCRRQGISRAEAVRRAVSRYLDGQRRHRCDDVFGIWRGRGIEGLTHERRLRSEWSRRSSPATQP